MIIKTLYESILLFFLKKKEYLAKKHLKVAFVSQYRGKKA